MRDSEAISTAHDGRFVIPVTVDDLAANGLLGEGRSEVCWERSAETLVARKDGVAGLAVASDEAVEAYVLHGMGGEILALRSVVEDDGARLTQLLTRLGSGPFRFPKVHPAEIQRERLEALGFSAGSRHIRFATRAQPD